MKHNQRPKFVTLAGAVILFVTVVLVYLPALKAGFIWDDDAHLTENPCIVGPLGFKGIWTSSSAVYYPLVLTSFWVLHAIWGLNPLPFHLVTIVMHAACAILLWQVLRRLNVRVAWFAALIWALHPVQVESVAWITELKNTQSCFFYLLAILFFLKWCVASIKPRGKERDYILSLLCAVLAILSKASTVMLPVVLALCWWWLGGRWNWRKNCLRLAPFFVISAVASGWTIWEQKFHSGAVGPEWAQSLPERFIIAGKAVWFYLGKLLWPHELIFIYPRWQINAAQWAGYLPALAVVIIFFVLWRNRNGWARSSFFAFAYFLVALFPVLGFFNVYFFRYSFVGDHFQYLASISIIALAASALIQGLSRLRLGQLGEKIFCLVLAAILATLTWHQCHMYHDAETLWRTTLQKNPDCWMAHNNWGRALVAEGKLDTALSHYREALKVKPEAWEVHNSLGVALNHLDQSSEAKAHFEKALELNPNYPDAHNNLGLILVDLDQYDEAMTHFSAQLKLNPRDATAYLNAGNLLGRQGRRTEAIQNYRLSLQLAPASADAHNNLACLLVQEREFNEAREHFQTAIRLNPNDAATYSNFGSSLLDQNRFDEAIIQLNQALKLNPKFADAHYNLGNAFVSLGRATEGIAEYQTTLELNPEFAPAHYRWGNVLLKEGKVDEASQHYRRALELQPEDAETHYQLAMILLRAKKTTDGISHLRRAVELKPDWVEALNNLAWILATQAQEKFRNGSEAMRLARHAAELTKEADIGVMDTLAAASAETGDFPEAIRAARRAAELAAMRGQKEMSIQIQARLQLYQSKQCYRE